MDNPNEQARKELAGVECIWNLNLVVMADLKPRTQAHKTAEKPWTGSLLDDLETKMPRDWA